ALNTDPQDATRGMMCHVGPALTSAGAALTSPNACFCPCKGPHIGHVSRAEKARRSGRAAMKKRDVPSMVVSALTQRIFGSANDRRIKKCQPQVDAINALEPELKALSDDQLRARTADFRQRIEN